MKFKNVAVNVSNLSKGGGAQIAIWLINKLSKDENLSVYLTYLVSPFVWEGIKDNFTESSNVHIISASPVRSRKAKKMVLDIIQKSKIESVYTLYGPSGITFDCKEVSGVANAWITCATLKDYVKVHGLSAPIEMLKYIFHGLSLRKKNFLIFETETSRDNYCSKFHYDSNKTTIIPNSVNDHFYQHLPEVKAEESQTFNILYVSAYYKHKNFEMIPKYALALKESSVIKKFKFQLTLSDKEYLFISSDIEKLNCNDVIENLGVLGSEELPSVYKSAGMVISPSVVETFSATYAEAILSGKYLAVADICSSREICKKAALYFNPFSVASFTKVAEDIYFKRNLDNVDVALSKSRELFISPKERYNLLKKMILSVSF